MTGDKDNTDNNASTPSKESKLDTELNETVENSEAAEPDTSTTDTPIEPPATTPVTEEASSKKPTPEKTPPPQPKAEQKTSGSKKILLLVLLLLLILIGGLAAAGYFGWLEWQQQQERIASLESETAKQNSSINQLGDASRNRLGSQQQLLQQLQQQQQLAQERLDSYAQRLRSLSGTSREDWLLAEARYLLRLANQRLLIEDNSASSVQLLEAADKLLVDLSDPMIIPVRKAIAVDITALKLAPKVDREGVYVQIAALKEQIQQLPLIPLISNLEMTENSASETSATDENSVWYQKVFASIKKALGTFKQFVQIRHHDEAPELLLSQQQQLQVINRLLLSLEQAQYALLRGEEVIYQASLDQATQSWKLYYSHYPQYESVSELLTTLRNATITQELPDIAGSARALTDYIDRFHQLNPPAALPETTKEENQQ